MRTHSLCEPAYAARASLVARMAVCPYDCSLPIGRHNRVFFSVRQYGLPWCAAVIRPWWQTTCRRFCQYCQFSPLLGLPIHMSVRWLQGYPTAPSSAMCRIGREELELAVGWLRGPSADVGTGHLGPEQVHRIDPIGNKACWMVRGPAVRDTLDPRHRRIGRCSRTKGRYARAVPNRRHGFS